MLARIIADLHDEDGKVTLPGFYDGVEELPPDARRAMEGAALRRGRVPARRRPVGAGRRNTTAACSRRSGRGRPATATASSGGYTGTGSKTVLPAQASAKVSFRLVGKQNPAKDRRRLPGLRAGPAAGGLQRRVHLARRQPRPGAALQFRGADPGAPRPRAPNGARSPCWPGSGGSIPIVGSFKQDLKMDSLMIGFALDDDRIHSPNEKYDLPSFQKGARSWARILDALAQ